MAVENGVQNAELGYLLFPFEQYSNLAGKPLVGGHMEIFEAGTDTKYISYQNWDGAENPFRIPIPNDGRITVLADPSKTFDCYLYDSYNNLVCSRLNVQANVPGNISIKGADTILKNTDGTLDIYLRTLGNNVREYTVNTHNKVLDVQEPLYFVENSNTATVIGFSGDNYVSTSTYNTDITNINNNITALSSDVEGKMDVDKLEFSNNKITGYDGSAFAGGGSVDPSEFVPWSASGAFQPSGNYYSASNPSGFINSDAISSMATTGFVADVSAEITALIPTAVTGDYLTKASADTLYYPLESNPSGYLTAHQDLSEYAKTEDLTAYQEKGDYYSASNPSGFLNKSSADELYAPTGDYATHDDLTAYQPSGNYADATALDGKVDTSSFTAFSSTTNEKIEYISGALSGTYELSAGEGIDITDYPNEQKTVISVTAQGGDPEVEQVVREYSAAGTWLTAHQDISNLMPKSESANFYPMTGNPSGFLTAHQSLEGYATEHWVGEQGYLTEVPASAISGKQDTSGMSAYVRHNESTCRIGEPNVSADQIALAQGANNVLASQTAFAQGTYTTARQYAIAQGGVDSQQTCSAYHFAVAQGPSTAIDNSLAQGYGNFASGAAIAQGDKNSAYDGQALGRDCVISGGMAIGRGNATSADAAFVIGNGTYTAGQWGPVLTERSDLFVIDKNGNVSSLSGKFYDKDGEVGGGDVPEGVMVESGLEFNAVQEISGYNGSAIAQYGAEKQWLTHDDTIVHVSNSAQYAFGVNVPNVVSASQELLGPVLNQETFAGYWNGYPEYQYLQEFHFNSNVGSNSALPDQIKRVSAVENRRHIDLSNSYIVYGNSWITLPLQWNLGNTRAGGFMIYDNGIYYRGYDSSPSDCTAFICYRYRKN